jgi:erythromycin esterase-like protein
MGTPLAKWEDLDPLMDRIGEARLVLLGEATHGTAEFYDWRRMISQRLIREKGFSFIAVEGDWPDCYNVNRYVKGLVASEMTARDVLQAFRRWPTWMWANEEVADLAEWLHDHNQGLAIREKVGFYGLDVYSLWDSMHHVLEYLKRVDGEAAQDARRAFACFEPYAYDEQGYARAARWVPASCEREVVQLLRAVRNKALCALDDPEGFFDAEQNALVARNAERYYRTMVRGSAESWNIRDRHMAETLHRLMDHHGPRAKAIVWEHNTHIGDARFTDMAADGMVNLGQLARQTYGVQDVVLAGFGTNEGSVIAADAWGAPMRRMPVPPGRFGSWEAVLHEAFHGDRLLVFDPAERWAECLEPRGHRAIGVVYHPEYESQGNYVPTVLPHRYDALIYLEQSQALQPLHQEAETDLEIPETYPTGM